MSMNTHTGSSKTNLSQLHPLDALVKNLFQSLELQFIRL